MNEELSRIQMQVQDKVILVQKAKEIQGKLKHLHMKIEFFKVEVKKIEGLKNTIRKKEEDIRRIEKVYNNSKNVYVKYENFIKNKNPIIENKELKKELEEIKNNKQIQQNGHLYTAKASLIDEIKALREKLESKGGGDAIRDDDIEELEIIVTGVKNRLVYEGYVVGEPINSE